MARKKNKSIWTEKRHNQLKELLADYRKTVREQTKDNPSITKAFPKFTLKTIEKNLKTVAEYNEFKKTLNKMHNKRAFKVTVSTRENHFVPFQMQLHSYLTERADKQAQKQKKKIWNEEMKLGKDKRGFTFGDISILKDQAKYNKNQLELKDVQTKKGALAWFENIGRKAFESYYTEKERFVKENYIKGLRATFIGASNSYAIDNIAELIISHIESMTPFEVTKIVETNAYASFEYLYTEDEMLDKLQDIADSFIGDQDHKVYEMIDGER